MSAAQSTAVFVNARIITLDLAQPVAEAMAVQDGRIIALGTKSEILSLAGSGASIADLEGQVVVPGFHDSHMHLLSWGLTMDGVQLEQARSAEELVELGRAYVRSNPDRQWIIGRGFNDETFSLRQLPTREDLDRVSVQQPVVFTRVCGHVCVVNSKALELAGIGEDTPEPPGGSLDRDRETGQPTGVLRENAMDLVMQLIPSPSVADWKRILRRACAQAAALGLTTIQSNDLNGASSLNKRLQAYRELDEAGELPIRIILQAGMPRLEDLQAYLEIVKAFQPSPMLTFGALKLFADGSLGGRTAALTSSYADAPDTDGMLIYSQEELDQLVLAAARSGLQVAVHAIGDRALDLVLNSYDHAKRLYPAWQRRPRVIHAQITRFDQLERLARLGAVADIQPIFVPTDMHFAERRVGTALAEYSYAWKTMLDLGIAAAGGSDCPVEPCNPLWGMHAAVTRQDRSGFPSGGWHPEQRLDGCTALRLFTTGSAYAAEEEKIKGALSPGKLADFVVLPQDPTAIDPQDLLDLKVTATYVGGKRVYP